MNDEPNQQFEERVLVLEKQVAVILQMVPMLTQAITAIGSSNAPLSQLMLTLWNGQIATFKFLAQSNRDLDEPTRQSFLRTVAQMESQSEKIEAIVAAMKMPPPNPPAQPPSN
jgi:hypothetical protein